MEIARIREVVVVVHDGVVLLDVAGPVQVLHGSGGYRVRLASVDGRAVRTDVGVPLDVELPVHQVRHRFDTLLVPGYALVTAQPPPALVAELPRLSGLARRTAAICTGAFLLAAARLLDGRRATTHWAACADLASRFPAVRVRPDALYVRDGPLFTSAGVTAGIDLTLTLVEEDHGPERARTTAKYLVVFLHRPGGQSQFTVRGSTTAAPGSALRRVLDAVAAEPAAPHTLATMAAHASVSERHLTRLFRHTVGTTPIRYVEQVRVEAAKTLLEATHDGVARIARACGFGSDDSMRRAFLRGIGITPAEYRQRFRSAHPTPER
ncbi:GlxA family transcriptional regulator [Micromonospora sp. DT178]|uniref:GlxA family transcriptional regulator n=1 Tax=Micromonospora sp. DT178 TaxID=3393436 RepID=UPI003CFAA90B